MERFNFCVECGNEYKGDINECPNCGSEDINYWIPELGN